MNVNCFNKMINILTFCDDFLCKYGQKNFLIKLHKAFKKDIVKKFRKREMFLYKITFIKTQRAKNGKIVQ